jgi:hypothetical protein
LCIDRIEIKCWFTGRHFSRDYCLPDTEQSMTKPPQDVVLVRCSPRCFVIAVEIRTGFCPMHHDAVSLETLKDRSSRIKKVAQPSCSVGSDYGRLIPRGDVEAFRLEGF